MGKVRLTHLTKIYDDTQGTETAVDDVSFTVEDGEFLVIVGPSGCGKSTTLRCIAGLETTTEGTIEIAGREVQDLAPSERDIDMAFQNFALYRKMTVAENLGYGLKHSTYLTKEERTDRVQWIAELLEIDGLLDHYPREISGGQKQRVALGRAIVCQPEVFLLDEPLSNLDAKLRDSLRTELQQLHDDLGITIIYVTHDQKEAMAMADRIAVMHDGRLQQIAPPEEAYHHPRNLFVATFLGSPEMNVLSVRARPARTGVVFEHEGMEVARLRDELVPDTPETAFVGFRPNEVTIHAEAGEGRFSAEVLVNEYQGKERYMYLQMNGEELIVRSPTALDLDRGDTVWISIPEDNVFLFDPDTGDALKTKSGAAAVLDSPTAPTEQAS